MGKKQYGAEKPPKRKKTRRERQRELRDDGFSKGVGVKYETVHNRHVDDNRFERELEFKKKLQEDSKKMEESTDGPKQPSATYDAFMRMATGKQERTIADKIADSNRPTWEEYKVEHEDKLDMAGAELKKMVEYRKELDANREKMLREAEARRDERKQEVLDKQEESDDSASDSRPKKRKKDRKKDRKKRKRKDYTSSSSNDSSDSESKIKKHKIDEGPVRLSSFLDASDDDI